MANPLHNYRVLIADPDHQLSDVLRIMLSQMGFGDVQLTRSGAEAFKAIQTTQVDFLVTEWNTQQMDGPNLIRAIRRHPLSPRPTLPVLMLTARAEQTDVMTMRDCGVNEYVVKPFSAKSIYNRLERMVEQPRRFVVCPQFIGPCRRHRGVPPAGMPDKRKQVLVPKLQPIDAARAVANSSLPKLWLPDFSLKYKLGSDISLNALITPQVLITAQAAIDAISGSSMQWIKENMNELMQLCEKLYFPDTAPTIGHEIGEVALSINARAGTFGFERAAEIAYMLYLFCRNQFQLSRPQHHVIVRKFAEVLQVVFGSNMRGDAGAVGAQIIIELKNLTKTGA